MFALPNFPSLYPSFPCLSALRLLHEVGRLLHTPACPQAGKLIPKTLVRWPQKVWKNIVGLDGVGNALLDQFVAL